MKKYLLSLLFVVAPLLSWGQAFDPEISEHPELAIKDIESRWASKSLTVNKAYTKTRIWGFAKAFCSQYQGYTPNLALLDYLKKPGRYDMDEKHYYVEDAPRNGYIKCDMMWQFDFKTEICYWRRPNGHSLVGVLMQMGHEGEGAKDDHALLFYDFNPITNTMTPDLQVYQSVKEILARHKGNSSMRLPLEGKDISVVCVEWIGTDEEDFRFEEFQLKWTGNGFK